MDKELIKEVMQTCNDSCSGGCGEFTDCEQDDAVEIIDLVTQANKQAVIEAVNDAQITVDGTVKNSNGKMLFNSGLGSAIKAITQALDIKPEEK